MKKQEALDKLNKYLEGVSSLSEDQFIQLSALLKEFIDYFNLNICEFMLEKGLERDIAELRQLKVNAVKNQAFEEAGKLRNEERIFKLANEIFKQGENKSPVFKVYNRTLLFFHYDELELERQIFKEIRNLISKNN